MSVGRRRGAVGDERGWGVGLARMARSAASRRSCVMYERLSSGAGAAAWCASRSRCCSRPCWRSLGFGSFLAIFLGIAVWC